MNPKKKFVVFGDYHLHNFADYAKPMTATLYGQELEVTDRLVAHVKTIDKLFEIAHENDADVIFVGDFFHSRYSIPTLVFNLGFDAIYENMQKYPNINMYMIVGNHDQKDNSRFPVHSLRSFRTIDRVHVLDEFRPMDIGSCVLYPVSYSDDTRFLKEQIVQYAQDAELQDKPTLLLGHIGIDGSETGRYSHRLEGAFKVGDLFPHIFTYGLFGHYHKWQFLAGLVHFLYTGNTIQTSFSDEGQDKGVWLVDVENIGRPQFIPIQNKKFITLTEVPDNAQEVIDNNYVRFVVPQSVATEIEVFKESTDNIRVEVQREYKSDLRIDIEVGSDEHTIVEAYTEKMYPHVTSIALDVLKEAKMRQTG
ncbi:exonuclease II [Bacillus phage Hobo]|uniref:Exonuclease subunit SbcD n=2 Tax=Caeruleovirus BM15 TaxID=1985178 RepID=A0A0S2MUM7_9CAUD|nr:exonuclease subunit SbcD [Bacillus phage BM15]ALO79525.1 exonuclease subunit SbcD [Bacillus phage BM15]AXQ66876.1 exonuclease II [Bacillus phage Hobo]